MKIKMEWTNYLELLALEVVVVLQQQVFLLGHRVSALPIFQNRQVSILDLVTGRKSNRIKIMKSHQPCGLSWHFYLSKCLRSLSHAFVACEHVLPAKRQKSF